jgi:hypothetical protein
MKTISSRRLTANDPAANPRVLFRVVALYGLSATGMRMPLNDRESIESGPICVTIDPDSDSASNNVGFIDFEQKFLKVRYGVQLVFPGLFELVVSKRYDATLLRPVRVTATDECAVTTDYSGWHALGCLDFLPGSIWAGAGGG